VGVPHSMVDGVVLAALALGDADLGLAAPGLVAPLAARARETLQRVAGLSAEQRAKALGRLAHKLGPPAGPTAGARAHEVHAGLRAYLARTAVATGAGDEQWDA
jgi:hypothetical protein